MANRRQEERERLREARQEREKQEAGSDRRRLMLGYGAAGLVGLLVVIGIVVALTSGGGDSGGEAHINQSSGSTNGLEPDTRDGTSPPAVKVANLEEAAQRAGCDLRLKLKDEGHTHLPVNSKVPDYETNPPTSGNHVEPPYQQADGAYRDMPPEINMVHSLEHGRMEIQYSPDLSEQDQLALVGLYDTLYGGTLLFPNDRMPYDVAATTWTNLLGCPEYKGAITLDAIRAFGKATWGRYGGEPVNAFSFTGPSPLDPEGEESS
jgi:Protein of unknown function (DUF3105)